MKALLEKERNNEQGFTLIEILVVILIIGILAAIAVPVFLNQRKKANDAVVESDMKNAITATETFFVNNPNAPYVSVADITKYMQKDPQVRITFTGNALAFCIEATHENSQYALGNPADYSKMLTYSSDKGTPYRGTNSGNKCEQVGGGEAVTHVRWNATA